MKNLTVFILINSILLVSGYVIYQYIKDQSISRDINSFEECVTAGNPVLESYPPQCRTKDGRSFTAQITPTLEPSVIESDIVVYSPLPNQTVSSPLSYSGRARGIWFFEAVFPVTLMDANGNTIAMEGASTEGEWMTEDFVEFGGEIVFETPQTDTGVVRFAKDNPSGLPENDKYYDVPVRFR